MCYEQKIQTQLMNDWVTEKKLRKNYMNKNQCIKYTTRNGFNEKSEV